MITTVIGRKFLDAYNEKFKKQYNPKSFFVKVYYPLFYDSNKYFQWVTNSPFVQMKKGQKVELLNGDERKEKLEDLISKIEKGYRDASVAIGYPASEEKEYATTSGQVSNINYNTTQDDIYLSWIGSSLGIGVQGGLSILFEKKEILLDIFEGWFFYRKSLDENPNLKGNQVSSAWNGQWLSHKYSKMYFPDNPMANFNPFTIKDNLMSVCVQSWTKVLIGISQTFSSPQMIGYLYSFGQTNITIGFIPFILTQIRRPIELYQKLFGIDSGKKAEELWGTAFGLTKACQAGIIGLRAMEPKSLSDCMEKGKIPKYCNEENQRINFNTYQIWIMAMLNNEELWAKAQEFAIVLQTYASGGSRGKTNNSNKVKEVLVSTNKSNFIKSLIEIVSDSENRGKIEEIASLVNMMPSDNVPYFLTLIRFHYASIQNK